MERMERDRERESQRIEREWREKYREIERKIQRNTEQTNRKSIEKQTIDVHHLMKRTRVHKHQYQRECHYV